MKINQDFTIQKVGSSFVAVPVGDSGKRFHGMVCLNETGAFLWDRMAENDCSEDDLVNALLSEYDVDDSTARTDVRKIVALLKENNLIA